MIAPQELRLGNMVKAPGSEQYFLVEKGVDIDNLSSGYIPILMTGEILQKCGFTFHEYFKIWQKNKSLLGTGPDMELDRDFWILDFAHRRIGVEIKSLHQLQNLYFSLKGRELEVHN